MKSVCVAREYELQREFVDGECKYLSSRQRQGGREEERE